MSNAQEWMTLKSGSDIRGRASEADGVPPRLTAESAEFSAAAFVEKLYKDSGKSPENLTIAVGHDPRLSADALCSAVIRGITSTGAEAVDCGLCTTPAMFMSTLPEFLSADGAIMVTASHLPWYMNGLKLITPHGGLTGTEIEQILLSAISLSEGSSVHNRAAVSGRARKADILTTYRNALKTVIDQNTGSGLSKPLAGLHVTVDAGNGSGGFYAELLSDLGADVTGSRYLEPDGRFPNHPPNPEMEQALIDLAESARLVHADIGVTFDADCDRAAFVGPDGAVLNRNRLIALISSVILKQHPGATIVTDSVTSTGLTAYITGLGGRHRRFKRGYKNVIDESKRLNGMGIDCPLAIETSGHAAFRDHYNLDDGMYLSTLLICEALRARQTGYCFTKALDNLREPLEATEIRLPVLSPDVSAAGSEAIRRVTAAVNRVSYLHVPQDNEEGIRVHADLDGGHDNAWFLLRISLHEPLLPLNIESDIEGGVDRLRRVLAEILHGCPDVDIKDLADK